MPYFLWFGDSEVALNAKQAGSHARFPQAYWLGDKRGEVTMRTRAVFLILAMFPVFASLTHVADAQCCVEPTFENSNPVAEATLIVPKGVTITMFQQTIGDSSGDGFNGYEVLETSPYGGTDGCYYPGAPPALQPTSEVTGGSWFVGRSGIDGANNGPNQWGYDLNGITSDLVDDIRANHALPCTINTPQQMYSWYTGSCISYPYYFDVQTNTINATTVTNCRGVNNGVPACKTVTYP